MAAPLFSSCFFFFFFKDFHVISIEKEGKKDDDCKKINIVRI